MPGREKDPVSRGKGKNTHIQAHAKDSGGALESPKTQGEPNLKWASHLAARPFVAQPTDRAPLLQGVIFYASPEPDRRSTVIVKVPLSHGAPRPPRHRKIPHRRVRMMMLHLAERPYIACPKSHSHRTPYVSHSLGACAKKANVGPRFYKTTKKKRIPLSRDAIFTERRISIVCRN